MGVWEYGSKELITRSRTTNTNFNISNEITLFE